MSYEQKAKETEYLQLAKKEGWEIITDPLDKKPRIIVEDVEFPVIHPYQIHLNMYRNGTTAESRLQHMIAVHNFLWPQHAQTHNYWQERIFAAHCERWKHVVLTGGASCGKAQPLWAKVHTPTGFKAMGELKIGDLVSCPDGTTSPVIAIHPQGSRPCYKIHFSDGTATVCDENHLWNVYSRKHPKRSKLLKTKDLLSDGYTNLPEYTAAPGISQNLPIHPYALGVILGNGGLTHQPVITFGTNHPQVIERFLQTWTYPTRKTKHPKKHCFTMGLPGSIPLFKQLGLLGHKSTEKFIPPAYLSAAPQDRWELLRGLIDTDGTVCKLGRVSYSTSSAKLARDTALLARSLGITVTQNIKYPHFTTSTGERKAGHVNYVLNLSHRNITGLCAGKQSRINPNRPKQLRKRITALEYYGEEECLCITIAHPDGLYFTNDFIVTHNSLGAAKVALIFWLSDPTRNACLVASVTLESLDRRIWGYVIKLAEQIQDRVPLRILEGKPQKIVYPGVKNRIHGMFATAVKQGSNERVIDTLIGQHPDKGLLVILDEATDMPAGVVASLPNLEETPFMFQLWAIGNASDKGDLHGALATPRKGWKSISPDHDYAWETCHKGGICLYFNPNDSPAITEPNPVKKALLGQFLMTTKKLDEKIAAYGKDSDAYYRFVLGFWNMADATTRVFTDIFLTENHVNKQPEWLGIRPLIKVAGLDPMYKINSRGCVLRIGILGQTTDGKVVIDFKREELLYHLEIRHRLLRSTEQQIADQAVKILKDHGIPLRLLTVDITGAGRAMPELIRKTMQTDDYALKVLSEGQRKGSRQNAIEEDDDNKLVISPTDIWMIFKEYIQQEQILGLDTVTQQQLINRHTVRNDKGLLLIERKIDYIDRMRAINPNLAHSPDEADVTMLCVLGAALRLGFVPGLVWEVPQQTISPYDLEKYRAFYELVRTQGAVAEQQQVAETARQTIRASFTSPLESKTAIEAERRLNQEMLRPRYLDRGLH